MADDKFPDSSDVPENGQGDSDSDDDGGLGNLPPLSDFESSGGTESDDGLPPMGEPEEAGGAPAPEEGQESVGGLPPVSDIPIETPTPTGGNIKAPPPGFESPEEDKESDFETPQFQTPPFASPPDEEGAEDKTGFQDLAADSDFSPETPEIGPGPDSDMDTPLFDSAFGEGAQPAVEVGAGNGDFTPQAGESTPAPTQAMETPMFGAETPQAGAAPFEEGAFGEGEGFDGTPPPDFSPDTGMPPAAEAAPEPGPPKAPKKKRARVGGGGMAGLAIKAALVIVSLAVGLILGPTLSSTVPIPNPPLTRAVQEKDTEISQLQQRVDRLTKLQEQAPDTVVSQDAIDELIATQEQLTASVGELTKKQEGAQAQLQQTQSQLELVRQDLEVKNEEFVTTQDAYETLEHQTAIVVARQKGLNAEVGRLTGLVGELEEANARRIASKEALTHSVDRLMVSIKEAIPLTPEKYRREDRVAMVEDLRAKVETAAGVTPALMDAYTSIYLRELEIGSTTEYFFAKIPATDRLGNKEMKWAECLMKGNWAVYYRTLDGKNVGSYQNVGEPGTPQYAFIETLPEKVQKQIQEEILANRVPDYEDKIAVLAQKQLITNEGTQLQRVFDSL